LVNKFLNSKSILTISLKRYLNPIRNLEGLKNQRKKIKEKTLNHNKNLVSSIKIEVIEIEIEGAEGAR
jgi:hypothetical protein